MLVLDAAGELDREARADRKIGRRAMIGAPGLRIECIAGPNGLGGSAPGR
jgi:hypothetical protein